MTGLELKINVRHTDSDKGKIRSVQRFNNFSFSQKFNALADTFSFDFYFDPRNQETAETVCVSHMHECEIYYNGKKHLTGFILDQRFIDTGKPELATISGYSKAGALNDCDTPLSQNLETSGLTLRQIIQESIKPFNLKLIVAPGTSAADTVFIDNTLDEDIDKTAAETTQNVGSYISELAKQKGLCLSHNADGNVLIKRANTKGTPLFNFDFTSTDPNNDARKIPVISCELEFKGSGLHTEITVVQQADDEEGTNASGPVTRKNPLIPIGRSFLYRPRNVIMSSGNQFTVDQCANYEMGKEIRDNVKLKIKLGVAAVDGKLITPDNTITIVNPSVFQYKLAINKVSKWYIEEVPTEIQPNSETCTLICVLPFGYDYDYESLKNVFVDAHKNLPL